MNQLTRLLTITLASSALSLVGCDKHAGDDHDHDHEHTHASADHDHGSETHEHAAGDADHDDHDDHAHDEERALGSVTVGGSTFDVVLAGDEMSEPELHVEITHTAGPKPAAVRLWIGDESGTGSLKTRADADAEHYHAHVEVPTPISPDAKLCIEVQAEDGTRATESIALR